MASNNYYGFNHGGTLHSSNSTTPYPAQSSAFPASGTASAYPPPPPPPAPGYDQNYQSAGTVQYPGVTVSSDYGYGAPAGAPAGFENAPYYPAAYYPHTASQPAYQTPEAGEQKPATGMMAANSSATSTAGNPWNKPKNTAGVLGTRERPGQKPFRGGMGGGGNRFRPGFGTGGPHQPRSEQLLYCDTCKISCAGPQAYKEHLAGQKHKKKEIATKAGATATIPKGGSALHCELCDITCTGSDAYAAHIRGSKHQKVVKLHQKLGKPIPSNEPTIISNTPSKDSASNGKSAETVPMIGPVKPAVSESKVADVDSKASKQVVESLTGQKVNIPKLPDELDVEPVGGTYIEEIREGGKVVTFNCKLCDCKFTDPNAKEMHLKGRRHRLQYKKKVDPSLEIVDKPTAKTKHVIGRAGDKMFPVGGARRGLLGNSPGDFSRMRMMEEGDRRYWDENWGMFGNGGPRFGPPGPGYGPPMGPMSMGAPPHPPSLMNMPPVPAPPFFGMGPPPRMGPSQGPQQSGWMTETISDRYVCAKHAELYPEEEELTAIQRLVANVEKALKMVSDVLANTNAASGGEDKGKTEASRILKGVMRVGILAKCLLLRGEREVELVVLCAEKPTRSLLQKVLETLPKQLSVVHGGTELYNLEQRYDEAAIRISTFKEPKSVVTVTFTSFLMRPENLDPKSTDASKPDPPDVLDKERCLDALAKLRHSKWYQAKANCVRHCTMIIRILRDFCRREPSWACIKEWTLELLVQRILESVPGEPLSAADSLGRIFEAVGGGWLLPGGFGLSDPCEKSDLDAAAYLTPQQVENITASAQVAVRRIAFRALYQVLDMPQNLPDKRVQNQPARKRRLEPEDQPGDKTEKSGSAATTALETAADKKTKVEPTDPALIGKVEQVVPDGGAN